MPTYKYTAKDAQGQTVQGAVEATTPADLRKVLYNKGLTLVSSKEDKISISLGQGSVKLKDFVIFCRQFAVILNAGLTIVEGISIMEEQTESKKLKIILGQVHEELLKGKAFSDTLSEHKDVFPEFFINMIRVGETSGSLDTILNRVAEYYEREDKMIKKVKGAMTYPVIVIVVAIAAIALLMVKVLPMFTGMFKDAGAELPGITKAVMAVSDFMGKNFIWLIIIIGGIVGGFIVYFKTEEGRYKWDYLKLNIPGIKTLQMKLITSKFARSMSILLKSGIPIVEAMDIMSGLMENKIAEEKFKKCEEEVKKGKGLSSPIREMNFFPPLLVHMVSVGENTGELDDMLGRTAVFFDEEVEAAVGTLTTMIEPILIVFLGGAIAVIVLAVMLPMVGMMNTIQ
ncbi:type IV pilus assembly protein PilC [Hathewaya proteolytica DSM 3090]|uniref:Type IV pilus assembly protein PilC n=1 Tax=Hathewaya proteolytica DSM 3090 TaxID=1121331 RepID=A0A1M6LHW7_9CLOT|nr:type II secretion system F family protein [Hathewaya proteolytica]SHJ70799.1 type IV pilus assembly protein PilC [Hathewaya proteolytica DSM 3090]